MVVLSARCATQTPEGDRAPAATAHPVAALADADVATGQSEAETEDSSPTVTATPGQIEGRVTDEGIPILVPSEDEGNGSEDDDAGSDPVPVADADLRMLDWTQCTSSEQFERPQVASVNLRNQPVHIGQLMTPGHTSVFIMGAEWCGPCQVIKEGLPELAAEFPDVMFTYINTGKRDSRRALAPFHQGNGINDLPYVYVVNACGVGIAWLVVESGKPLLDKIRAKLESLER